jgi:hypothetical protein
MKSSTAAVYLPDCPSSLLIWAWVRSTGNTVTFPPNPDAFAAKARACGQAPSRSMEHTINIGAGAVIIRWNGEASSRRVLYTDPEGTGSVVDQSFVDRPDL